jgi:hypothetical protein
MADSESWTEFLKSTFKARWCGTPCLQIGFANRLRWERRVVMQRARVVPASVLIVPALPRIEVDEMRLRPARDKV